MIHNGNFSSDLSFGEKGEQFIKEYLNNKKWSLEKVDYRTHDYDLFGRTPNGKEARLEVKTDNYSTSMNIVIEYYNKRTQRASGIATSKSNIWINFHPHFNFFYAIETKKLREFLLTNEEVGHIGGGDKNTSKLYIMTRVAFEEQLSLSNIPFKKIELESSIL